MPETVVKKHFEDEKFHMKKYPIFMKNCYDNGCELKGDFNDYIILNHDNIIKILKKNEKSVDRIVFARKIQSKKVNVLLCELSTGKKKQRDVLEKIKYSGEFIIQLLEHYGFKVINFDCIYLGRYEEEKRIKKTQKFTIKGCSRHNLKIRQFNCGTSIDKIKNLNFLVDI